MKKLLIITALATTSLTSACGIYPPYRVWESKMNGEAELAQAEQNRQVQVAQSKAKAQAAEYEAQAEVTRARGVAQANMIIGNSLKNNEAYLRYLYVNNLENSKNQIIYVPTEASLPILEASRLDRAFGNADTNKH